MAAYPPPPPGQFGSGNYKADWKYQRKMMREQARAQRDMLRAQRNAYREQARGMRRGSIVGPILLIAIGVVFLLVQMGKVASAMIWGFYGRWWPMLLIGAGIVVLAEWGFDQVTHRDTTQPYVRRSLGGGVVWLLILFAAVGICAQSVHTGWTPFNMHFNQEDLDQFMGDKHESDQTLAQAFPVQGSLRVDNPRGDVTISGTSDDSQIHVLVHKEIYSRSDDEAAEKAQKLSPSLTADGNGLQLTLPALEGARADLIVTLPAASSNTVVANHGDVHMSSLKGPLNITSNHGDVEISAITGAVIAHILNGDSDFSAHSITGAVTLEGRGKDITVNDVNGAVSMQGEFFGDTHLEHIGSNIRFHTSRTEFQLARLDGEMDISPHADLSADQAVGPVVLNTRSRNITLDRIAGDVTVTNKNGKVDLTSAPPLGNISIENRNGEVNVIVPEDSAFNVTAETTEADIENDFALPVTSQGNNKSMTGNVGSGKSTIKIVTTQEDVSLKRATVQPLPPSPPSPPSITAMPAEAKRAIADAKKTAREAEKSAHEAEKAAKAIEDDKP